MLSSMIASTEEKKPPLTWFSMMSSNVLTLCGSKKLLDLHDSGVNDDVLNLLYETSKNTEISIKTPVGNTRTKKVKDIIMQGETRGKD